MEPLSGSFFVCGSALQAGFSQLPIMLGVAIESPPEGGTTNSTRKPLQRAAGTFIVFELLLVRYESS